MQCLAQWDVVLESPVSVKSHPASPCCVKLLVCMSPVLLRSNVDLLAPAVELHGEQLMAVNSRDNEFRR